MFLSSKEIGVKSKPPVPPLNWEKLRKYKSEQDLDNEKYAAEIAQGNIPYTKKQAEIKQIEKLSEVILLVDLFINHPHKYNQWFERHDFKEPQIAQLLIKLELTFKQTNQKLEEQIALAKNTILKELKLDNTLQRNLIEKLSRLMSFKLESIRSVYLYFKKFINKCQANVNRDSLWQQSFPESLKQDGENKAHPKSYEYKY